MKAAGEVDFIGCAALDPGPAVALPAAREGQMNATRLGFCRTDADEPAVMGTSTGDRDANKEPAPDHPRDQDSYTTRKTAELIQIKVRRHRTGTLTDRSAGDKR